MKRAHLPAYSSVAPQRALVLSVPVRRREKPDAAAEVVTIWRHLDLGSSMLSLPRDLRPRSL